MINMTTKRTTAITLAFVTVSLFAATTPYAYAQIPGVDIPNVLDIDIPDVLPNLLIDCGPGEVPIPIVTPSGKIIGWTCPAVQIFFAEEYMP
jgi:hypothetical protein